MLSVAVSAGRTFKSRYHAAVKLGAVSVAATLVAGAELAADRLGPRLLPSMPTGVTEAGFKLGRLGELRRGGSSPRVLTIGASPTGTCLDPAAISAQGVTGRVFNACLPGSTVSVRGDGVSCESTRGNPRWCWSVFSP